MAGFLYFKPHHVAPVTRQLIAEWGLGYAFPRAVAAGLCNSNTPAAAPGTVFADPDLQGDRPIKMDFAGNDPPQIWRRLPISDVWCGYWRDAPPEPHELARQPQLPGYPVVLGGGREWLIPIVRRFDPAQQQLKSNLPTYMVCDDDGNWHRGAVTEIHAKLWEVTTPIADAMLAEFIDQRHVELTDAQILDCLSNLVQANYRVGPGELSLMQAFTSESGTHAACALACDWPNFEIWAAEIQKKSDSPPLSDGSTMSSGEAT
jgi:hypothetical protein